MKNRGEQTLKSIFIDQVDIHTGEGVALRSIASRWPTIIADFMQLNDNDIDYKKISKDKKKNVSEAEGVILATKNKLYIEWRDRLFKQTVEERFRTLLGLMQARKKSVDEYKSMLRPLMARYKMLSEGLSDKESRHAMRKLSFFRPESQAISLDFAKWWAWKPFAPAEKYKVSRQTPFDKVHAIQAGFLPEEIEILKAPKEDGGAELKDEKISALPVEPSIDSVFRLIAQRVQKVYDVPINAADFYEARKMMLDRFESSSKATASYEPWVWSPYFIFIEMPVFRTVIRFPNGSELENIFFENITGAAQTQNIILGHYLELVARDKQTDQYLLQMLGEAGAKGETIKELLRENEWKTTEEKKVENEKRKTAEEMKKKFGQAKGKVSTARVTMGKTLENVGINSAFLRGEGPYEFAFRDRFSKYFFPEVALAYDAVVTYMKAAFQVPGSRFL